MTIEGSDPAVQPFSWPVRVYYEDTDAAGVVYYANYLRYMERARTEWLRAQGYEQPDIVNAAGVVFVVRAVNIEYLKPARFNDSLRVSVEVATVGGSRIRFDQRVWRNQECVTQAQVEVVCVDAQSMKPARVPAALRTMMAAESETARNSGA